MNEERSFIVSAIYNGEGVRLHHEIEAMQFCSG